MSKPWIHAESSARRFGGTPEDYIDIHDFMDSSKSAFPDNRHRALTHNSWFIFVVEKVFGHNLYIETDLPCDNCHGTSKRDPNDPFNVQKQDVFMDAACICNYSGHKWKYVSVRDVAEQHILEDFGGKYIPTVSDYLEGMEFQDWMNNGIKGNPTSHRKIVNKKGKGKRKVMNLD